jgi:hypothetical protein
LPPVSWWWEWQSSVPWRQSSAVALRVAREEELAFEAAAETLEQRLDVRLARIEAQLAGVDARLQAWSTVSVDDAVRSGRDDQ